MKTSSFKINVLFFKGNIKQLLESYLFASIYSLQQYLRTEEWVVSELHA